MRPIPLAAACSLAAFALCITAILVPARAWAQAPGHGTTAGPVADLPPGEGIIFGRVVHPAGPARVAGLQIALYALAQTGPGLRGATTDAQGAFRFEGISNDPGVVYLLGANYREVPFGQRLVFSEGQTELEVKVEVSDPTADASGVSLRESTLRLDWLGASLAVAETHDLVVAGAGVVLVHPDERSRTPAPFSVGLPAGAFELDFSAGAFGEGFEQRGDEVLYWGPLYEGDQQIRFRYMVPLEEGPNILSLRLAAEAKRLTILVPSEAPPVMGEGLGAGEALEIDGRQYRSLQRDLEALPLAKGARLELAVELPESRNDPSALRIARADMWLELDDASLEVSADLKLEIEGPHRLAGTPGAPLLHLALPPGAEFSGLSPEAQRLGAVIGEHGGLDILGPIPPGEARIAFSYRLPVEHAAAATKLDLHFSAPVAQLNLLIADTGVLVENDRLHRRRPFRSGTRIYLHREGFQLEPDETIELSMTPLQRGKDSQRASMAATLALAAGCVWFIFAPLGAGRDRQESEVKSAPSTVREREAVYDSIRDLDHDHETGKIDADEYARMRGELRAKAVELLREEREARDLAQSVGDSEASAASAAGSHGFCPTCGIAVTAGWRFCAGCGANLPEPAGESPASQSAG